MTSPILIVDDEPTNLAILRQTLSPQYPLVFARSGDEALAAAEKHGPALILLDILMPDMDGYAVCRKLKADPQTANIPVIFITGLTEVGDETAGFEAGAVDYIVKPISPAIVRARVRTHLSLVSAVQLEQSYHDALSMDRPYKEGWPVERIMEFMTGAGTHFGPRLIEHFIRILPEIVALKDEWHTREAIQEKLP